jgi:DNA replication protein DnaC
MSHPKAGLQATAIQQQCKLLRLPAVGSQCAGLAELAVKEKQSHLDYLEALLAAELEERERNTVARRLRDAHLPRMKTLEEFDFAQSPKISAAEIRQLAEGGYIERAESVLLIGDCGTGKTHLMTGLCVAACRQKRRVRFTTTAGLVNELVEAKHQLQLRRVMARWSRYELIAIDEVGYVPLADLGAVAVGIPVAWHPPHGSVRALISAYGSYLGYLAARRYSACRTPANLWDTRAPLCVGCVRD